jgi:fatty-acid desaturase
MSKMNNYFWITFLPLHLMWLASFIWIQFDFRFFMSTFIFWILLSGYGIGVGFHRLLAHKSFQTSYWIRIIVSYLGSLGAQGSPAFWVNIHRGYHHPYADKEKDIHSPIHGKGWAYLLWPIQTQYSDIQFRWVSDLLRDPIQRILHYRYFWVVGLTWIIVLTISPALFIALIWAQFITLHQEFCVNLFCHSKSFGYRNFETDDFSNNIYLFGLLFWGVGYHNNHHAKPNDYNFGKLKHEIDFTRALIWPIRKREPSGNL